MLTFFSAIFGAMWIQENWKTIVAVLVVLVVLLIYYRQKKKQRRAAYLALPVIYIGNSATRVYHRPSCQKIAGLSQQNAVAFRTQEEVIRSGYAPCGHCKP